MKFNDVEDVVVTEVRDGTMNEVVWTVNVEGGPWPATLKCENVSGWEIGRAHV